MSRATEPRRVALEVLRAVRRGEFADRALAQQGSALPPRDHAWVQELIYGTFRLRGRLDHILRAFVRQGLQSLEEDVLDVLRLGTYQLVEMGGVPGYAAVSQSVELVREAGASRAAGLVNGVLQSIRRGASEVPFPDLVGDPIGHFTTWGSHPRWLVERWVARWGVEETARLVELNNTRPELYLRPVGLSAEAAATALRDGGVETAQVPGFPDSLALAAGADLGRALSLVPAVVQDPAAASVVRYADFPAGSRLIDLAAAPGGKTVGLAEHASFVAAADLSAGRLRRVRANVERTGMSARVGLVVSDGRTPPFRPVDGVLLDAPCTGTGTLRRHADARWRLGPPDLEALQRLQREILRGAATIVCPGGHLVYSTCSIEPEENEEQVEWFLGEYPDFRLDPPTVERGENPTVAPYLSLLPQRHGTDGAFAARFTRD